MEIFKSILPVLFFAIINSAVSIVIKKGFGKCLPLTFMVSTFTVFLSQLLFNTFIIGLYVLIVLFIVSIAYIGIHYKESKYILTNGLYIFICLSLIFLFIDFGRHFFWDDEVGFWGKMVKELFRLDKFYCVDESTLRGHNDYPPFMPLFEYIWCKLSLGYSECNCTFALHIFEFGILIPSIFDNYFENKKKFEKLLLNILVTLSFVGIVIYLDASDVFNTIYVDTAIALQFAYSIYLIYSREIENYFGAICYGIIMATMIMTKQVAIAFCLLSLFYLFVSNTKTLNKKEVFVSIFLGLFLPLVLYFGWNQIIKPYDIVKQFDFSKLSVSGLIKALNGNTYQLETIRLYVNALFKTCIYKFPVPTTFVSSVVIELLLLEIIKYKCIDDEGIVPFMITCVIGTFGYMLLMFVLYVFCYPEREALTLICYDRYMSSFIAAMFVCILIIVVNKCRKQIDGFSIQKFFIVVLIILAIFDGNRLLDFVPQVLLGNRFSEFEKLANEIDSQVKPGSNIFVVYNHDDLTVYPSNISYYSNENFFQKRNFDLCNNDYSNIELLDETISELKTCDYLYIVNKTDSFDLYFSKLSLDNRFEKGLYKRIDDNMAVFDKVD